MEHIILHETAKLAREAGFDRLTEMTYDGVGTLIHERWNKAAAHPSFTPCCYQDEVKNWLLEKKQIHMDFLFDDNVWSVRVGQFTVPDFCPDASFYLEEQLSYKNSIKAYHAIKEKGIQEALKMVIK